MEQDKSPKVINLTAQTNLSEIRKHVKKEASPKKGNSSDLGKAVNRFGSELSIIQINNADGNVNKVQKPLNNNRNSNKPQKRLATELTITCITNSSEQEISDKPFECPDCHKTFSGRSGLYTHMKSHNAVKPYACEVCGKKFSSVPYLTCHMKAHSGEKPFECEVCHRSFSNNGSLSTHKTIHAEFKPFKCEICDRDFPHEGTLRWHKKRLHPDNEDTSEPQPDKSKASKQKRKADNKNLNYAEATEQTAWMLQFAD